MKLIRVEAVPDKLVLVNVQTVVCVRAETARLIKTYPVDDSIGHVKRVSALSDGTNQVIVQNIAEDDPLYTKVKIIQVPGLQASTREQHVEWCRIWPITLRLPPLVPITKDQEDDFVVFMPENGCVVVDPATRLVLVTVPETLPHNINGKDMATACIAPKAKDASGAYPLHHAVIVAIAQIGKIPREQQFLLNGLDIYCAVEPCVMCAMALVHSRIRRVYYSLPHAHGALGSMHNVHTHRSLNHHYSVFKPQVESRLSE